MLYTDACMCILDSCVCICVLCVDVVDGNSNIVHDSSTVTALSIDEIKRSGSDLDEKVQIQQVSISFARCHFFPIILMVCLFVCLLVCLLVCYLDCFCKTVVFYEYSTRFESWVCWINPNTEYASNRRCCSY